MSDPLHPKPGACPCGYGNPCQKHCTCVEPWSSRGCRRCCRYGSLEQRQYRAAYLSAHEQNEIALFRALSAVVADAPDAIIEARKLLERCMKELGTDWTYAIHGEEQRKEFIDKQILET